MIQCEDHFFSIYNGCITTKIEHTECSIGSSKDCLHTRKNGLTNFEFIKYLHWQLNLR